MVTHATAYELQNSRDAAGASIGGQPQRTWSTNVVDLALNAIGGQQQSDPLDAGIIPLSAWMGIMSFCPLMHVFGKVLGDTPANFCVEAERGASTTGLSYWAVDGAFAASALDPFVASPTIALGRLAPPVVLQFEDDIFGVDVVAETAQLVCHWQEQIWDGLIRFGDFEDIPPNTVNTSATGIQELLKQLQTGGEGAYTVGIEGNGTPRVAQACTLAKNGPDGVVWIADGDIGNNPEQIPNSVANNTAARFRFHPSVFIRRGAYARVITRRVIDTVGIAATASGQPYRINVCTSTPSFSRWLFVVDGQPLIVTIFHATFTEDLRRPIDIWNQKIVPFINGSQSLDGVLTAFGANIAGNGTVLLASRLRYLEYARFLMHDGDITTPPQDDTSPG